MTDASERDLLFNGELEIFPIKEELHDEIIEFYINDFIKTENFGIALGFPNSELAIGERSGIIRVALQDNLGYIVRHCETKEIVAFSINKIRYPSTTTDTLSGNQFQSPAVIRGIEFLHDIKSFDIFKEWNIDCVMELEFLSTRKDFGGRGLATILSVRSIEFARRMLAGTLSEDQKNALPEHIRESKPKAVCAIFSSIFTQKVGEKLEFKTLVEIPYAEMFYEGKSFAESIDPIHKSVSYAGKIL